jgi:hypothetical protein
MIMEHGNIHYRDLDKEKIEKNWKKYLSIYL